MPIQSQNINIMLQNYNYEIYKLPTFCHTVGHCPMCLVQFFKVSSFMKTEKTSWTHSRNQRGNSVRS